MNKEPINYFKSYFADLTDKKELTLNQFYTDDIVFNDPMHEIHGLENLKAYFDKLNDNLKSGKFKFTDETIINGKAYLSWVMLLSLKRPNKSIEASGISVLHFDNKIFSQRDYFDAGEVFYENIPLLGGIIKTIKKRI